MRRPSPTLRRSTPAATLPLLALAALLTLPFPEAARAQGWIEPPATTLRSRQVVKTRSDVRATVEGRVARFEVTEWFRNDGGLVAEGHYLYPLPGEAVFQGFSLFQGDAELRGEVMDAREARRIYEEIVRRNADPALIELAGHGLLRARVFPIQPGEERKVTLRFTQVLERAGGALQLSYAGAVRGDDGQPRPGPAPQIGPRREDLAPRATAAPRGSFHLVAEDGDAFLQPFSPTHALTTRREGGRLDVRLDGPPTGRLSLFLPLADASVGLSVATHRLPGEDGYFLLTLTPGHETGAAVPRDVTVVLDVSGSMSGGKMAQAKAALHQLLGTLGEGDRFRLLAFSNAVRMAGEGWWGTGPDELARARRWIDGLVADGGTNIGEALGRAFEATTPEGRLPVVLFLTDGLPSVGEQTPERLAELAEARSGRARIFAFGVGHDVNTLLLDRLGDAGRGATQYVEPGEDVERAVGLLATKVRHPVLTDLEIDDAPVRLEEIYPVRLPDLFAGEELVVLGRYGGQGEGTLAVRGTRGREARRYEARADFPRHSEANAWLPRLWASRKLGHLTRQIWTEGATESLVEQIREVALRYGLPSEYTSYLVTEPDMVVDGVGGPALPHDPAAAAPGRGGVQLDAMVVTGATAVRRAEEARQMREASSTEALERAEAEIVARFDDRDRAGSAATRLVAGRAFRLEDGRWIDRSRAHADAVREIRRFSPAYFALLRALPELAPVLRELDAVTVAGARIVLAFGDEGAERLSEREVRAVVRGFRGS